MLLWPAIEQLIDDKCSSQIPSRGNQINKYLNVILPALTSVRYILKGELPLTSKCSIFTFVLSKQKESISYHITQLFPGATRRVCLITLINQNLDS